ncbi:hypothetical protein OAG51_03480 [Pirellulaceae bacterium]|nr:hypothetical protein [Pirellulaceae bacterium]
MSTMVEPELDSAVTSNSESVSRIRSLMAACRLGFTWFGTSKSLSDEQKAIVALSFGADQEVLSAGKRLLCTKHPAYKQVNSIKSRITAYWKGETLPFPHSGIRLIRQGDVEQFNNRLHTFQEELTESVEELDRVYTQLKDSARQRLGELFDPSDYPESLNGLFSVNWDFPSVEVPDYLRRLKPELYRQEADRVARRFDQALEMAESAFMEEFQQLIDHLTERLAGNEDGKPKVFRDTAVTNLTSFFERFRRLNIRSNEELDSLVNACQQVVNGRTPQALRDNQSIRDSVAGDLQQIGNQLDQLLVDRPRRNLIRKAR